MNTNITPQQIVERYLSNRKERFAEYKNLPENKNRWLSSVEESFDWDYFAEALAERDRQMCKKQREICSDEFYKNRLFSDADEIEEIVRNAPMPKMDK